MVSQVAEPTLFFFPENSNSQQSSSCTWTYFPASIIFRVIVFRKSFTGNCCSPGLLQRELKCYTWNNSPITTINHLKVQTELLTFLTLLLQLDAHIIYPVTAKKKQVCWDCAGRNPRLYCATLLLALTIQNILRSISLCITGEHCAPFCSICILAKINCLYRLCVSCSSNFLLFFNQQSEDTVAGSNVQLWH